MFPDKVLEMSGDFHLIRQRIDDRFAREQRDLCRPAASLIGPLKQTNVKSSGASDLERPGNRIGRHRPISDGVFVRLWRAFNPHEEPGWAEPHDFTDVDPLSYANDDISLIAALEITTGTSPGFYSPTDFVTREQMAAFLGRFIRAIYRDPVAEG